MNIPCFICKKEFHIKDSYVYVAKDRLYRKTKREDVAGVPFDIINTSSKTDVVFVCEDCYKEKTAEQ